MKVSQKISFPKRNELVTLVFYLKEEIKTKNKEIMPLKVHVIDLRTGYFTLSTKFRIKSNAAKTAGIIICIHIKLLIYWLSKGLILFIKYRYRAFSTSL